MDENFNDTFTFQTKQKDNKRSYFCRVLLLEYQHYACGWTFTDIGPYSIQSKRITSTSVSQFFSTGYSVKSEAWLNFPKNLEKQYFTLGEQNDFRPEATKIIHRSQKTTTMTSLRRVWQVKCFVFTPQNISILYI